jgi:hypothetical protein
MDPGAKAPRLAAAGARAAQPPATWQAHGLCGGGGGFN